MRYPGRPDEAWNDELERELADQREAWRGDVHSAAEPWQADAGDAAWRGEEHFADWPEASAGPEYWMYKGATRRV